MSGKPWTIGQEWDEFRRTDFFKGKIDDVKIYDRALSPAEIREELISHDQNVIGTRHHKITCLRSQSVDYSWLSGKVEELREACIESDVKLIACQMTMDVFGFSTDEFIDDIELGGAATFLEFDAGGRPAYVHFGGRAYPRVD